MTSVAIARDDDSQSDDGGGHPSFKVGMESSSERLHELQFSLVHAAAEASRHHYTGGDGGFLLDPDEDGGEEDEDDQAADPAIIAAEIEELAVQSHENTGGGSGHPSFNVQETIFEEYVDEEQRQQHIPLDDGAENDLLPAIPRLDSREVVFDNRVKKAKVLEGRYVMGSVLGEGSYAKVKEAVDARTLCRRAVKIMKKKKLRKIPHGEQNVAGEIALLKKLSHPNVMALIEVLRNEEKGKIYLVLEYCVAVLKDMLETSEMGRFPPWQAHFYFLQLLTGLEYLHGQRVIHKDIKPGNLLLDTAGVLKIADFGTAEVLDLFAPDDTCTTNQGTPAFQPPEIATGEDTFKGFKADVWSAGVTLYNLVTGGYPFSGDTIFRLFEDIARCQYELPSELDPALQSLLKGMLTKLPDDRLTLLQVRQHDWCRKKHPVSSPPVTVRPRDPEDPAISTTVIPYLCDLHYGSQVLLSEAAAIANDQENQRDVPTDQGGLITEHELRVRREQQIGERSNGHKAEDCEKLDQEAEESSERESSEKTTRCIKVKKMGGCSLC